MRNTLRKILSFCSANYCVIFSFQKNPQSTFWKTVLSWTFVTTLPSHNMTSAATHALTAAFLVAVVDAVIGAVTACPLGDTAVVCLAGKLGFLITLVIWAHWTERQRHHSQVESPSFWHMEFTLFTYHCQLCSQ